MAMDTILNFYSLNRKFDSKLFFHTFCDDVVNADVIQLSLVHTSEISKSTSTNSWHTHAQKSLGSWMTNSERAYAWRFYLCLCLSHECESGLSVKICLHYRGTVVRECFAIGQGVKFVGQKN